jgi:ABC-2 type transport system permease protein
LNWAKTRHVMRREYTESVRKKSFLFGLLATPLMMLGLVALPLLAGGDLDAGTADPGGGVYFRAVALVMIMFFALVPTGQILMRSVIEEKASRVIEVLLSSVTATELMVGKIVGLGTVGLTLVGTWAAIGALIAWRFGGGFPIGGADAGMFLLFFLPGYFFYAALLGSIGSICHAERDAQPFLTPISLMLILPVMLGFAIAQSPDHALVRIASFIPFFAPSLMLFRWTIHPPPPGEIAATWAALVAATCVMFWASSRIFRIGILLTGKRPTIAEVARWVRAR